MNAVLVKKASGVQPRRRGVVERLYEHVNVGFDSSHGSSGDEWHFGSAVKCLLATA
eukprot:CAMPEP_0171140796 /NCGR_PEP_ID=MMETSP0766_2-20121228/139410_1 /TAXON_ID=439317 /ORGANISM="Gambierdiscus australes, Strain CAWD 149" /LENGTH=55 /DNA_ID=CAMNT_0011604499 /DNA_START=43 /DNA_END=207 /DNA_ORIENTATION=+